MPTAFGNAPFDRRPFDRRPFAVNPFGGVPDPPLPPLSTGQVALAHYKAQDIVGVAGGADVTSWPDDSGNGFTLTEVTDPPSFLPAALGGFPAVRFDGTEVMSNTVITASVNGGLEGVWYFAVCRPIVWQASDYLWTMDAGPGAGIARCGVRQIGSTPDVEGFISVGGTDQSELTLNNWHLVLSRSRFASAYLWIDDAAKPILQNWGSDSALAEFYIGGQPGVGIGRAQFDLLELIIFDEVTVDFLTDQDQADMRTYLNDKYSLGFTIVL